jgi:hypothetical protein
MDYPSSAKGNEWEEMPSELSSRLISPVRERREMNLQTLAAKKANLLLTTVLVEIANKLTWAMRVDRFQAVARTFEP